MFATNRNSSFAQLTCPSTFSTRLRFFFSPSAASPAALFMHRTASGLGNGGWLQLQRISNGWGGCRPM